MYRRIARVLLFAFPCLGLLGLLRLSNTSEQRRVQQVRVPSPEVTAVKFSIERVPSNEVERLPEVEPDFGLGRPFPQHVDSPAAHEVSEGSHGQVTSEQIDAVRQPEPADPQSETVLNVVEQDRLQRPKGSAFNRQMPINVPTSQVAVDSFPNEHSSETAAAERAMASVILAEKEPAFGNTARVVDIVPPSKHPGDATTLDSALVPSEAIELPTESQQANIGQLVDPEPLEQRSAPASAASFDTLADEKRKSVPSVNGLLKNHTEGTESHVATAPVSSSADPVTWTPLDIRNVEIDRSLIENQRSNVKQSASAEGRRQAQKALSLGFELLQRGAPYSARSRFFEALQIVARSLDDANGSGDHLRSLKLARDAYEEAGDFYPKNSRPDQHVNLASVAAGHETRVLRNADFGEMSPARCVREYLAFADQEFAKALSGEDAGSRALYGIGRLEASPQTTSSPNASVRAYRAMALYQAAMKVSPSNFAAANELGVLLAKYDQTEAAIAAFQQSVNHHPHPTAWRNLAHLNGRLGRFELARQAEMEASRFASRSLTAPFAAAQPKVEWVQPEQFQRTFSPDAHSVQMAQQPSPSPSTTAAPGSKKSHRAARSMWPFGWGRTR